MRSTNFKRILAHKLGNLLMLSRNPADMIDDPDLPPDQREQLKAMLIDSLERMEEIVRDLTDLGRAEELDSEPHGVFHPGELVEQVVDQGRRLAEEKGVALVFRQMNGLAVKLCGQVDLIERAVTGLLEIALQSTPSGGQVEIMVGLEDGCAVIGVADGGPGFEPEDLPHVFDPFFQSRHRRHADLPNLGLTLTLARAVTEAHGGRVAAESDGEAGSTFWLILPLDRHAS